MKKEIWKEADVLALPPGEQDYFERKSGAILSDGKFHDDVAKAISAFANSGGGHLIIGVKDNGEFDGVPKVLKGKQSTKDHFEHIIPDLVTYTLQDFRVHEVMPESPSLIPEGRVIIVVDIGDSLQAPHQTSQTRNYYFRTGGRSEKASHHFLELLRARARYPSQRVAHTWLNHVIRPFLEKLRGEYDRLNDMRLGWDYTAKELSVVAHFYVREGQISLNQTQFLEAHEEIETALNRHDEAINNLLREVALFSRLMQTSINFHELYREAISPNSLRHVRLKYFANEDFDDDDKIIAALFGSMSEGDRLGVLAQHVINNDLNLPHSKMISPLWNENRDIFMRILAYPDIAKHCDRVLKKQRALLEIITHLISEMERIRRELAIKFGEVYEDETLRHFNSPQSRW